MASLQAVKHAWRMTNPWAPLVRDHRDRPVPMFRLDRYGLRPDRQSALPRPVFDRIRAALLKRTRRGMGGPPVVFLALAAYQLGVMVYALTFGQPPWMVIASQLTTAAFCIGLAVLYRFSIPRVERELIVAAMLAERRCASCAYDLSVAPPDSDGRTTCSECAAAWAMPTAPPLETVPRPLPAAGTIPCMSCRYDLRGLITLRGATCPECGTVHSFRQLTEIDPYLPPIHLLWYLSLSPVAAVVVTFIGTWMQRAGYVSGSTASTAAWIAGVLVAFAVFYRIFVQPLSRHGRGFALILAVLPAAALTAALAFLVIAALDRQ